MDKKQRDLFIFFNKRAKMTELIGVHLTSHSNTLLLSLAFISFSDLNIADIHFVTIQESLNLRALDNFLSIQI